MAVNDRFWDSIYQQYHDRLLRQVQKYLPTRDESLDVLQDLYIQLRNRDVDPAAVANPPAYMMRMATNLAIDVVRRSNRSPVEYGDPGDMVDWSEGGAQTATPEQISVDRQRLDIVAMAIRDLPPRCREVFLLCKRDHLSTEEAATQLGISRNMVEKHLRQALRHCKEVLARHEN